MQDSRNIPQHAENLRPEVRSKAAEIGSFDAAAKQATMPERSSDRRGVLGRFYRWIAEKIAQDAPAGGEICAFDCRKEQCTQEEWAHCERRLTRAAGELWPGIETRASEQSAPAHERTQLQSAARVDDSDSEGPAVSSAE